MMKINLLGLQDEANCQRRRPGYYFKVLGMFLGINIHSDYVISCLAAVYHADNRTMVGVA